MRVESDSLCLVLEGEVWKTKGERKEGEGGRGRGEGKAKRLFYFGRESGWCFEGERDRSVMVPNCGQKFEKVLRCMEDRHSKNECRDTIQDFLRCQRDVRSVE